MVLTLLDKKKYVVMKNGIVTRRGYLEKKPNSYFEKKQD